MRSNCALASGLAWIVDEREGGRYLRCPSVQTPPKEEIDPDGRGWSGACSNRRREGEGERVIPLKSFAVDASDHRWGGESEWSNPIWEFRVLRTLRLGRDRAREGFDWPFNMIGSGPEINFRESVIRMNHAILIVSYDSCNELCDSRASRQRALIRIDLGLNSIVS